MKDVLFIIPDNYQIDNAFPLGIGYLSSVLQKLGANVTTYCMDIFHYSLINLKTYLLENKFDLIGIGFLAPRFEETIVDLCNIVNEYKNDAQFVLGGHGASPIPEYILKRTNANIVVMGEGERIITDIYNEINLEKINGIAYNKNNKIIVNERQQPIKDLDSIPFPLWSIFPIDDYIDGVKFVGCNPEDRLFPIISSRGCVNKCGFCYRLEKGIRFRSISNVIKEIEELHRLYNINYFKIQDECFVLTEKRVEEFSNAFNNLDFDIKYTCECIPNHLTENIAYMLKKSGCAFIDFGFENMNAKVLKFLPKGTTPEDNIRAAKIARKYDLPMGLNFIWNCPYDNTETLYENAKFLKQYNNYAQIRTIRPMTPYPGCPFYYKAIADNKLKNSEEFFSKFKNSDRIVANFMDMDEDVCYESLYQVNKDLIFDHAKHTDMTDEEANNLIKEYYKLYFLDSDYKFRGVRHYNLKKDEA